MNGEEFKTARKALGLTQAQMGDLVGVSRQSVINWEKEIHPIDKAVILVIKIMQASSKAMQERIIKGEI